MQSSLFRLEGQTLWRRSRPVWVAYLFDAAWAVESSLRE